MVKEVASGLQATRRGRRDDQEDERGARRRRWTQAVPFGTDHLSKPPPKKKKKKAKRFENRNEKPLAKRDSLEVKIKDPDWTAGIQSSEDLLLNQYEDLLRQHEWPGTRAPTITSAETILKAVNVKGIQDQELVNLKNFLEIIVNYILRGQGGAKSEAAGAFEDVAGMPSKQAFTLMARTDFVSMYRTLLSNQERRLFRKIVEDDVMLKQMGIDRKAPVFVKGYGKESHERGPTVYQWIAGIPQGKDRLSATRGGTHQRRHGRS